MSAPLAAQQAPPPSHWELVSVRSGLHENATPVEGVVWRDFVSLPAGTPWLRLYYSKVFLDKGSYLRIVSLLDGDYMTQHQQHVEQWSSTSCFFNGNAVMIELIAGPHTRKNYVEIDKVMAGDAVATVLPPETICGTTDDRVPSSDARVGRINNVGCTGWIINSPAVGNDKCHLSAGHCYGTSTVLQFAVPASNTTCSLRNPPAAKQFAIDAASSQRIDGGVGNDWWAYRCFPNSTTGRTTFQEQGAAFDLAAAMPGIGATLRLTGFGIDGTPTNGAGGNSCSCLNPNGARNQTQQTSTGPVASNAGTTLSYAVDTCGGDSGSPVVDESTGLAVAIHTHGGCTTATAANLGTQITHTGLQAAIAAVSPGGGLHVHEECFQAAIVATGVYGPYNNVPAGTSLPSWPCGVGTGKDIWFKLHACPGAYTITTCTPARTLDTVLQIFSGTCAALTPLDCNDDAGGACGTGSTLNVTLAAGTYYVRVGGANGATGVFELSISAPCASNDECSGALPLQLGLNGPYNNLSAGTSFPGPLCNGYNDIWFTYDVPCSNARVSFYNCGSAPTFNTTLQLFSGSCAWVTILYCNDDGCPTVGPSYAWAEPGIERLYLRLGGQGPAARGTSNLTVEMIPTDDECVFSKTVTDGINGPFSNIGATTSAEAWPCSTVGRDIWFAYTPTCTGNLVVSTCTAARTFDTVLEVLRGACYSQVSLGCNDDAGGACGTGSSLTVPVQQNQPYFIRIGGFGGATGLAELSIACIPLSDECANAATIATGHNGPFSTQTATTSAPAFACGAAAGNDCWFAYTAGCTAPHTFTTCSPTRSFDTVLEVFDGGCGALNSLGCNDDGCDGTGSSLTVNLVNGATYHVRVGGVGGATGSFDLRVTPGGGTGSITLAGTGCGTATIAVTGNPWIGGTVDMALGGIAGVPFIGLGFAIGNTPFCGVCNIGHDWASAAFGSTRALTVPCDPVFMGAQLGVQGADFLGPGCPSPTLGLTSTYRVTIG